MDEREYQQSWKINNFERMEKRPPSTIGIPLRTEGKTRLWTTKRTMERLKPFWIPQEKTLTTCLYKFMLMITIKMINVRGIMSRQNRTILQCNNTSILKSLCSYFLRNNILRMAGLYSYAEMSLLHTRDIEYL
jgi:hypothetical protein